MTATIDGDMKRTGPLQPQAPHSQPSRHSPIQIATFNCDTGGSKKLAPIARWALSMNIDIVALQEVGDPSLSPSRSTLTDTGFSL